MDGAKVAIVTGASSGIGRQTALALSKRGYVVFLASRRVEALEETAQMCSSTGAEVRVVPTDVSDRVEVDALVQGAVDEFGRVDVMVNNAGYGIRARVHETTDEQMHRIFEVNFFGVFYGSQAVAPIMIQQRSGHIFNVSSVIGKRGTPFSGAYCATKFAICGLTDSLRVEMRPYNVRVTCVLPGLTDTEFFKHVEGGTKRTASSFRVLRGMQAASVVGRKIAATVGKNRPELIFTPGGRFLAFIAALSPRLTDAMMEIYHDRIRDSVGPS
ncbi:MAG: SDR family NAD(P)-dependent oxidoreductase [Planctomycetota bacterium]|jgi:short-subunit dehydrogenase